MHYVKRIFIEKLLSKNFGGSRKTEVAQPEKCQGVAKPFSMLNPAYFTPAHQINDTSTASGVKQVKYDCSASGLTRQPSRAERTVSLPKTQRAPASFSGAKIPFIYHYPDSDTYYLGPEEGIGGGVTSQCNQR